MYAMTNGCLPETWRRECGSQAHFVVALSWIRHEELELERQGHDER